MIKTVIFDLDQTLVDSSSVETFRDSRNWHSVYENLSAITTYDRIQDVLDFLKTHNIKTALVSSSPSNYCKKVISNFHWSFDTMVCFHDTKKRKPNPDPIILAMHRLNGNKDFTLSLGDRDIDIVASNLAGVISGACLWGAKDKKNLLDSAPDQIFESPSNLYDYLIANT
jgi:HAD superfamily hydrolase (TIGR01549 family)